MRVRASKEGRLVGQVPGSMHRLFSQDKIQSEKPLRLEVDQLEGAQGRGDVIQGQGGHTRRRCGEVEDPKPPTSLPEVGVHHILVRSAQNRATSFVIV